ncbi:hypothetical protein TI39_contig86g00008 [Zymoseptoria brevis]|uniref:Uncharacterized protein n=1 Tax=Zymoseptoria brevis TaxID=1047168 RepID=A0A0F4GXK9_9PEZI|nr:hypothetical protein TI39_contig86g00008 [Zymoseptoria brevis]
MSKRKAEDDGRDGIEDKKMLTDEDLVKMAKKMTIGLDPDQQRLPNEIMRKICQYMSMDARAIDLPLGTRRLKVPEDRIQLNRFVFAGLQGMFNASLTMRRMLSTHMVHQTTFTTRLDLATNGATRFVPARELSRMPDIIRKNVRKLQVQVYFSGPATVHAIEEWARLWYEPGLLRQMAKGDTEQEVEVVAKTCLADKVDGFKTGDGTRFWPWGVQMIDCFLDDVHAVAEDLVVEENRQAANESNFVIGVNFPELKSRLASMPVDKPCDKHFQRGDWKWDCWQCFHHEVHAGWAVSAGLLERT